MHARRLLLVLAASMVPSCVATAPAVRRTPRPLARGPVSAKAAVKITPIAATKSTNRMELLDEEITVEGVYFDEGVPLLVRDIDLTRANSLLPDDAYLVLSGNAPKSVVSGDRIKLQGTLRQPSGRHSLWMQREKSVLEVRTTSLAKVVSRASVSRRGHIPPATLPRGRIAEGVRHAVLICGGGGRAQWRRRYVNEMTGVYRYLQRVGCNDASIHVLYRDGETCFGASTFYDDIPVDGPATRAAISRTFDHLAEIVGEGQQLTVYTTGPGGGFYHRQQGTEGMLGMRSGVDGGILDVDGDEEHDHTYESLYDLDLNHDGDTDDVVAYDEVLYLHGGDRITDDEFAAEMEKVAGCGITIYVGQQSYSGGFAADLAGPNRILLTACTQKQRSWAYEPASPLSEFTYWLLQYADWKPVRSIYNGILMCNRMMPLETAAYDDNGVMPLQVGRLERRESEDGELGGHTCL